MLKKLVIWAFLQWAKPMQANKAGKIALFLYNLDSDSEFFHLITTEENTLATKPHPYEVYWQSKRQKTVYGPFASVHSAMEHFTLTVAMHKQAQVEVVPLPANVIEVDFKNRQRILK